MVYGVSSSVLLAYVNPLYVHVKFSCSGSRQLIVTVVGMLAHTVYRIHKPGYLVQLLTRTFGTHASYNSILVQQLYLCVQVLVGTQIAHQKLCFFRVHAKKLLIVNNTTVCDFDNFHEAIVLL